MGRRSKRGSRAGALAVLVLALGLPSWASASPQLALRFRGGALGASSSIEIRLLALGDTTGGGTAAASISVPSAYGLDLGARAGVAVGEASGVFATGGGLERFTGRLGAVDPPAAIAGDPCLSTPREAWWRLEPLQPSALPPISIGVDRAPAGPADPRAGWRIEPCLGAAQGGGRLFGLDLRLPRVFANPPVPGHLPLVDGVHPARCRPPRRREPRPRSPAGASHARGATRRSKTRPLVDLAGAVTEAGTRPPRTSIDLYRGLSRAALRDPLLPQNMFLGTVPAFRRFDVTVRDRGGSFYRVLAWIDDALPRPAPPDACAGPSLAPGGCVTASVAGFSVFSPIVRKR